MFFQINKNTKIKTVLIYGIKITNLSFLDPLTKKKSTIKLIVNKYIIDKKKYIIMIIKIWL